MAYNLTLDDTSPVISYSPWSDGTSTGAWSLWYNVSGSIPADHPNALGNIPEGTSFHISNNSEGANMTFSFNGTGIYIYGETTCNWEADLDLLPFVFQLSEVTEDATDYPDVLLGGWDDLVPEEHTMTIRPLCEKGQQFAFDRAVYTIDTTATTDNPLRLTTFTNDDLEWSYTGDWSVNTTSAIPTVESPYQYHAAHTYSSSARLAFYGRGITVNGATSSASANYSVLVDGVGRGYNASSWWLVGSTTLFDLPTGLDPTVQHELLIVVDSSSSKNSTNDLLILNGATVYGLLDDPLAVGGALPTPEHPDGPLGSVSGAQSKSHTGAIVGGVIGGIIGLGLIIFALLWLRRRYASSDSTSKSSLGPYFFGGVAAPGTESQDKSGTIARFRSSSKGDRASAGWKELENSGVAKSGGEGGAAAGVMKRPGHAREKSEMIRRLSLSLTSPITGAVGAVSNAVGSPNANGRKNSASSGHFELSSMSPTTPRVDEEAHEDYEEEGGRGSPNVVLGDVEAGNDPRTPPPPPRRSTARPSSIASTSNMSHRVPVPSSTPYGASPPASPSHTLAHEPVPISPVSGPGTAFANAYDDIAIARGTPPPHESYARVQRNPFADPQ